LLVNDAVKVIEKKRAFNITRVYNVLRILSLRIPKASTVTSIINSLNNRVIWYSATLLLYFWFLYWIAYDIFVWHKPITEISPINFAGAITAMALIWIGTKLPATFKIPLKHTIRLPQKHENPKPQNEPRKEAKPKKRKQHTLKPPTPQPTPQTPTPQPQQHQTPPQPPQTKLQTCTHHYGYLHQPGNINNIPDECLTCQKVTKCLTQIQE